MIHMKTATIRDLRSHFPKLEAWLHQGDSVAITKHGVHVASLVPAAPAQARGKKVDFAAQAKRIWGDTQFSEEQTRDMLGSYRDGEEG
jgi:antitoxin (DNA-binding transcriptional repressor) of toxin-antitoxin stability system